MCQREREREREREKVPVDYLRSLKYSAANSNKKWKSKENFNISALHRKKMTPFTLVSVELDHFLFDRKKTPNGRHPR